MDSETLKTTFQAIWGFVKSTVETVTFAGISGAGLSALYFLKAENFMAKFSNFVAASVFTFYVTPFAIEQLNYTKDGAKACLAFAIGLIGLALSIMVWDWFKTKLADLKIQDILPWIKKGQ